MAHLIEFLKESVFEDVANVALSAKHQQRWTFEHLRVGIILPYPRMIEKSRTFFCKSYLPAITQT